MLKTVGLGFRKKKNMQNYGLGMLQVLLGLILQCFYWSSSGRGRCPRVQAQEV